MSKGEHSHKVLGAALMFTAPQYAFASDMGNGPLMLTVWLVGGLFAVGLSLLVASKRDELGAMQGVDKGRFARYLMLSLPIVFVLGLVALALG